MVTVYCKFWYVQQFQFCILNHILLYFHNCSLVIIFDILKTNNHKQYIEKLYYIIINFIFSFNHKIDIFNYTTMHILEEIQIKNQESSLKKATYHSLF